MVRLTTRAASLGLALMLLIVGARASADELRASVDRESVAVGESFQLLFESAGDLPSTIDTSPLEKDFEILGSNKSTNISIVNGETSRRTTVALTLIPKRAGQLRIPPVRIGNTASKPLALTVKPPRSGTGGDPGDEVFIELDASPRAPYVQSQVVYTIRLFRAVDLDNARLSEPTLEGGDAVIERLGEDKNYEVRRGGRRFVVTERSYAIFPQQSGSITVQPVVLDADVFEARKRRFADPFDGGLFDPFGRPSRRIRVRSEALELDVQPIPPSAGATHWLPARDLQLAETWSEDPPRFVVGEPVTRTLALVADGLTSAQLPAMAADYPPELKLYPDQPDLRDQERGGGIIGIRQEKMAIIPTAPGLYRLPAIEIAWWDTANNRLARASLPGREIHVQPAEGTATPSPPATRAPENSTTTPAPIVAPPGGAGAPATLAGGAGWWPWLALLLALGWAATGFAWWRFGAPRRNDALVPTTPDAMVRGAAERRVERACSSGDSSACKTAILDWGQALWPDDPPRSLGALGLRVSEPLASALEDLNRALYAKKAPAPPWNGTVLYEELRRFHRASGSAGREGKATLQPLYLR